MARMWEVVGGVDKGGVLVREGKDLSSLQLETRLSTGATVEEIDLVDGRLHFRRVTGSGPTQGWISVSVSGKPLVKLRSSPTEKTTAKAPAARQTPGRQALAGIPPSSTTTAGNKSWKEGSAWKLPGARPTHGAGQDAAGQRARDKVSSQATRQNLLDAWDSGIQSLLKDRPAQQQPDLSDAGQTYFSGSQVLDERNERFCLENGKESCVALPREALEWDDRECDLWFRTHGSFHPRESVGLYRKPLPNSEHHLPVSQQDRISVIMPTTERRQKYHELIWLCFEAQDWPDKELVVVETYHGYPSMFFAEKARQDTRVTYLAFQHHENEDWSIGTKRNMAIHVSTGEFIAHFDDDDLYASNYLSKMISDLKRGRPRAKAAKLATWYMADVRFGSFALCDPLRLGRERGNIRNNPQVKSRLYGFGFSYVYHRSLALEIPFDDLFGGEDYSFYSKVMDHLGARAIDLIDDEHGLCLHIKHAQNLTDSNVCKVASLTLEQVLSLNVGSSPGFNVYLHLAGMGGHPLTPELQVLAAELLGMQTPMVEIDGKAYLLGEDCKVYNPETREAVGTFNASTQEIEPIIYQSSEPDRFGSPGKERSVVLEELDATEERDPGVFGAGTCAAALKPASVAELGNDSSTVYDIDWDNAIGGDEKPKAESSVDVWGLD